MPKTLWLVVFAALALASPPAASEDPERTPARDEPLRVAVYEFRGADVPARILAITTNALVAELRKLERVAAIGIDEIKDMLTHEESKRLLGCSEESCLAEIAGAMGVDELITGSLSTVGESSVINLRRLHLRTAASRGSVDRRLAPDDGAEFLAAIGPAVEQLYPDLPLRPDAERGVAAEVALRLDPPPLAPWVFWTTAGAAVALGLTAGGLGIAQQLEVESYNRKLDDALDGGTVYGYELEDSKDRAAQLRDAAIGVGAVAGALVLGAILEALFTDWWGYGDEGIAVAPLAGERGVGAAASITLP